MKVSKEDDLKTQLKQVHKYKILFNEFAVCRHFALTVSDTESKYRKKIKNEFCYKFDQFLYSIYGQATNFTWKNVGAQKNVAIAIFIYFRVY